MNVWLYLVPAFLAIATGAVCTYVKPIRDSVWYWPLFVGASLALSAVWILASRRLDDTYRIMLFSLAWDSLMVLAYYGGPVVYKAVYEGQPISWQVYAAGATTVAGLVWFKLSTGS